MLLFVKIKFFLSLYDTQFMLVTHLHIIDISEKIRLGIYKDMLAQFYRIVTVYRVIQATIKIVYILIYINNFLLKVIHKIGKIKNYFSYFM